MELYKTLQPVLTPLLGILAVILGFILRALQRELREKRWEPQDPGPVPDPDKLIQKPQRLEESLVRVFARQNTSKFALSALVNLGRPTPIDQVTTVVHALSGDKA